MGFKSRTIFQYSKADWDSIRNKTKDFVSDLMGNLNDHTPDENYSKLKTHVDQVVKDHIPSKKVTTRYNVPWISTSVKRMCRKKQRLYNKARRTGKPRHWVEFRAHKRATLRALRRSRWTFINNILDLSLTEKNSKL